MALGVVRASGGLLCLALWCGMPAWAGTVEQGLAAFQAGDSGAFRRAL